MILTPASSIIFTASSILAVLTKASDVTTIRTCAVLHIDTIFCAPTEKLSMTGIRS